MLAPNTSILPGSSPPRLISLDVFRGLVILAMLIVNNLGDYGTTGYFWKHADWLPLSHSEMYTQWWASLGTGPGAWHAWFTGFPLWQQCTLADFVMPWFMLCIGLAMPFSVAASNAKGIPASVQWLRTLKRAFMLVLLGWILCYFRDQFAKWLYSPAGTPLSINLGMDVLQLLGFAYLYSRVLYDLPLVSRGAVALGMFFIHWVILRASDQGPGVEPGTFTAQQNAISHMYRSWPIFGGFDPLAWMPGAGGVVTMGFAGMLSAIPATATMLLGSMAGDWMRDCSWKPSGKTAALMAFGLALGVLGVLVGFDIAFNKPRWSPSYLLFTTGVGICISALLLKFLDKPSADKQQVQSLLSRPLIYFCVVLGANSIAAYFLSIMAKVLLLNTPRVDTSSLIAMALVKWLGLLVLVGLCVLAALRGSKWAHSTLRKPGLVCWWGLWLVPVVFYAIAFALHSVSPAASPRWESLTQITGLLLKQAPLTLLPFEQASRWGNWIGGWTFTLLFVTTCWLVLDIAYKRKIFWKL